MTYNFKSFGIHLCDMYMYFMTYQFLFLFFFLFRFRAERLRKEADQLPRSKVVPAVEYLRSSRLPTDDADTSVVFLCRQVYDFKLKRILKNPS